MYTIYINNQYEDIINWLLKEISKGFKVSPLNILIFFAIIFIDISYKKDFMRVLFTKIKDTYRDKIIRYIFEH